MGSEQHASSGAAELEDRLPAQALADGDSAGWFECFYRAAAAGEGRADAPSLSGRACKPGALMSSAPAMTTVRATGAAALAATLQLRPRHRVPDGLLRDP